MKIIIVAAIEGCYLLVKKNKVPAVMIKKIKEHYKYSINKKHTKVEEYVKKTNEICNNCILVLFFSKETIESFKERPKQKRFILFMGEGSRERRTLILNIFNGNLMILFYVFLVCHCLLTKCNI